MAWEPKQNTADFRYVVTNLLAYIEANQADALAWASDTPLEPFVALYPNAAGRLGSLYPNLMVVRQDQAMDFSGDVLIAGIELLLEGVVTGPDADQLVIDAKAYAMAVESMLLNIPHRTLTASGKQSGLEVIMEMETQFDVLRGQKTATSFLQLWQTRVVFRIHSAGFSV
jgi:hypothetical protein